ncbi:MAG: hypothetical protein J6U70_03875 [Bacteroidales bacterium]|nr:hypothetical protein [Bacteroidales bacterium]
MNTYFSFTRFGRLLRQDWQDCSRHFWILILSSVGAYLAFWLFCALFFDFSIGTTGRSILTQCLFSLMMFLAPYRLFQNVNKRLEGYLYGITPASVLEKVLSMILIASVFFGCVEVVSIYSVDSLLSLLPTPYGFEGHLWQNAIQCETSMLNTLMDSQTYEFVTTLAAPPMLLSLMLKQSWFIYFNTLFRSNKIGYTILVLIGISIASSTLSGLFAFASLYAMDIELMEGTVTMETIFSNLTPYIWVASLLTYVVPVIFWVLTYFRIKKIQY